LKNTNLWATCARLVICEESLGSIVKSSSQDRNTFMVAVISKALEIYEFKVVLNQENKKDSYNSWVAIHS